MAKASGGTTWVANGSSTVDGPPTYGRTSSGESIGGRTAVASGEAQEGQPSPPTVPQTGQRAPDMGRSSSVTVTNGT
ncbi:hypothetical protein KCMC57_up46260 [Kitasatospora sp. CMC57]|uniref:Uncharacterized protein n=1 Tax=Kitasatospora sp. CMC57 TaxID=3231513 RepID=A0AB33K6Z4_9ACTN